MKSAPASAPVEPSNLGLGHLALFVGMRVDALVLEAMEEAGFEGVRNSHGYVFQHLLGGTPSVGELATLLGVSQQAASKTVRELEDLGLVETVKAKDGRARNVTLSKRGLAAVEAARDARTKVERMLSKRCGDTKVAAARTLLAQALDLLGGTAAVKSRRVRQAR